MTNEKCRIATHAIREANIFLISCVIETFNQRKECFSKSLLERFIRLNFVIGINKDEE
jgi:hypothetical protein